MNEEILYIICPLCYYYVNVDISDISPYDIILSCQCGYKKTLSIDDFTIKIAETNKKFKEEGKNINSLQYCNCNKNKNVSIVNHVSYLFVMHALRSHI